MLRKVILVLVAVLFQRCRGFRSGGLVYRLESAEHELSCFSDGACIAIFEEKFGNGRKRSIEIGRTPDFGKQWSETVLLDDKESKGLSASLSCLEQDTNRICVAAWARRTGEVMLSKSLDGGVSWTPAVEVFINVTERVTQPFVSCFVDPQSTAPLQDFECLLIVRRQNPGSFLSALRLSNGTETFDSMVDIPGFDSLNPSDHKIACQADASYCVISFIGCSPGIGCNVFSTRTVTSGLNWTQPLQIPTSNEFDQVRQNENNTASFFDVSVACAPGTQVCVLVTDPYYFEPRVSRQFKEQWIEVARSEDGGNSWNQMEVIHTTNEKSLCRRPTVSCSAAPHCVIAWEVIEAAFENESPFYSISSDYGTTWGPVMRIQDLPKIVGYRKVEISCSKSVEGCLAMFKIDEADLMFASLDDFNPPPPTTTAPSGPPSNADDADADETNKAILAMGIVGSASGLLLLSGLAISIYRSKDLGGMAQRMSFRPSKLSISNSASVFDDDSTVTGSKTPVPPQKRSTFFGSSSAETSEFSLSSHAPYNEV